MPLSLHPSVPPSLPQSLTVSVFACIFSLQVYFWTSSSPATSLSPHDGRPVDSAVFLLPPHAPAKHLLLLTAVSEWHRAAMCSALVPAAAHCSLLNVHCLVQCCHIRCSSASCWFLVGEVPIGYSHVLLSVLRAVLNFTVCSDHDAERRCSAAQSQRTVQ